MVRFFQENPTESIIDLEDADYVNENIKIHRFFTYLDTRFNQYDQNWLVYIEFDAKVCKEERIMQLLYALDLEKFGEMKQHLQALGWFARMVIFKDDGEKTVSHT